MPFNNCWSFSMNHLKLAAIATVALIASAAHAETTTVRPNLAQNGGEQTTQSAPAYNTGLNGRVKPAVRPNLAQNGGENVASVTTVTYAAGLNGRVKPAVRPNLAQNGGEVATASTVAYASGLNGRVKSPAMADHPAVQVARAASTQVAYALSDLHHPAFVAHH
jgi:hypothetical protein